MVTQIFSNFFCTPVKFHINNVDSQLKKINLYKLSEDELDYYNIIVSYYSERPIDNAEKYFRAINRCEISNKLLKNQNISQKTLNRILSKKVRDCSIDKNITLHSLRASSCTNMISNNIPESYAINRSGHKSKEGFRKYVRSTVKMDLRVQNSNKKLKIEKSKGIKYLNNCAIKDSNINIYINK